MKNVDSKKLAGTIIGGIAFIFCLIFFTYAWYEWRSDNTVLGGDITDVTQIDITLDNDGDVSSSNIGPVLNPEDGIVAGFSADNKDTKPGHLYIDLKINSIDSELLRDNFKYLIVKSTVSPRTDEEIDKSTLTYDYDNPVASGDFSNFKVATNLLGEDNVSAQTITFYKILIYLDGSTETDINQQGKSINAELIITDTKIKLSDVKIGSYVAYTGNNGCSNNLCNGQNANYEEDVTNGYCYNSEHEFNSSGWRLAYVYEESPYIISAGAPECLQTYGQSKSSLMSISYNKNIYSSSEVNGTYSNGRLQLTLSNPATYNLSNSTMANYYLNKFICSDGSNICYNNISTVDAGNSSSVLYKSDWNLLKGSTTFNIPIGHTYYYSSNFKIYSDRRIELTNVQSSTSLISNVFICSGATSSVCSEIYYIKSISTNNNFYNIQSEFYGMTSAPITLFYFPTTNNYYFGRSFKFNANTGTSILAATSSLNWQNKYTNIKNQYKYTCLETSVYSNCNTIYEIDSTSNSSTVNYYKYTATDGNVSSHITRMNTTAKKYCNKDYAYNGTCDNNSAWGMNVNDFEKITGSLLYYNSYSDKSCYNLSSNEQCGYNNDLIDNGGSYWFGKSYATSEYYALTWAGNNRNSDMKKTSLSLGVRPVLRLESSIYITGGSGTKEDPYIIQN